MSLEKQKMTSVEGRGQSAMLDQPTLGGEKVDNLLKEEYRGVEISFR